jgi:hypothetical protein
MDKMQFGVFAGNYQKDADVLLHEALESDRKSETELLLYLIKHNNQ